MARFQQSFVISMFLALSASLCLASSPGPAASSPLAEGPVPDYDLSLSPAKAEFLEEVFQELTQCGDSLGQGVGDKCVDTIFDRVLHNTGPMPNQKCCENVLVIDVVSPGCWDLLFPEAENRAFVPDIVGYCSKAVKSPTAAPSPRKTFGLNY